MRKTSFLISVLLPGVMAGAFFLAGCHLLSTREEPSSRRVDCVWATHLEGIDCGEFARKKDCFSYAQTFEQCFGYHCTACE